MGKIIQLSPRRGEYRTDFFRKSYFLKPSCIQLTFCLVCAKGNTESYFLDESRFFAMVVFLRELAKNGLRLEKSIKKRQWQLKHKNERQLFALANNSRKSLWNLRPFFYFALLDEINERRTRGRI